MYTGARVRVRRFVAMFVALVLSAGLVPAAALAEAISDEPEQDSQVPIYYAFTESDATLYLSADQTGDSGRVYSSSCSPNDQGAYFEGRGVVSVDGSWGWHEYAQKSRMVVIDSRIAPKSMAFWFSDFSALTSIEGLEKIDASQVTSMRGMFEGCTSLVRLDLRGLDTGCVVDMGYMFDGCSLLASLDMRDLSTGKVTDMGHMFNNCYELALLDMRGLATDKVTNMQYMFTWCRSLVTLDLSSFKVDSVTDTSYMFCNCGNIKRIYVKPDTDWFAVTGYYIWSEGMFSGCEQLAGETGTGYQSTQVGNFYARLDTASNPGYFSLVPMCAVLVDSADGACKGEAGDFVFVRSSEAGDGSTAREIVDADGARYHGYLYAGVENLEPAASAQDVPWHERAASVKRAYVDSGQTLRPANCAHWFSGCEKMVSCDLSGFDCSGATSMAGMFEGCGLLSEAKLGAGFSFGRGEATELCALPTLSTEAPNTGRWINSDAPGEVLGVTPAALAAGYTGAASYTGSAADDSYAAGTYIPERVGTVTLDAGQATKAGLAAVHESYDIGVFLNEDGGAYVGRMSTSDNPVKLPARAYKVSYNAGEGTCPQESAVASYAFKGYYSSAESDGDMLIDSKGYATSALVKSEPGSASTLYAHWASAGVTLPTPKRAGYQFGGWYTHADGAGDKVGVGGEEYTPSADVTLYAKWTAGGDLSEGAEVSLGGGSAVYDGTAHTPTVTVEFGKTLDADSDYSVKYANNTNAGTATVTVTGTGAYSGTVTKTFSIAKAQNTMRTKLNKKVTVTAKKAKKKTTKKKKTSKKKKTVKKKTPPVKAGTVSNAVGTVVFKKLASGSSKNLTVSNSGVVKAKAGTKKGTYKLRVQVCASGDANHVPMTKTYTMKVKVKVKGKGTSK